MLDRTSLAHAPIGARLTRAAIPVALLLAGACAAETASPTGAPGGERTAALGGLTYAVDVSVWSGPITDDEMDCFWDDGVRHVIVGTQDARRARQQLDMALARGMSVDAYVYLHWDADMRGQVEEALELVSDYPVGRLWLDVEEDPDGLSRRALMDRVGQALDACGDFPCGIYTGRWWWQPYGLDEFGDVPLWYAHYDGDPDIGTWSSQRFGAWDEPYGKQWMGDIYLCGIDVDKNSIYVDSEPIADHPLPEVAPSGVPERPRGLYPDDVTVESWQDVRLLWGTVVGATGYEAEVEFYSGGAWRPYFTYRPGDNARWLTPGVSDAAYRFRVRAENGAGFGPWSDHARFYFGAVDEMPPVEAEEESGTGFESGTESESGTGSESGSESGSEPEPEPGVPNGLEPDGAHVTTASVTLTWNGVDGADLYEVDIDFESGGSWRDYYTYSGATEERTFWPSASGTTYRFRVRARVGGGWSEWSPFGTFDFQ